VCGEFHHEIRVFTTGSLNNTLSPSPNSKTTIFGTTTPRPCASRNSYLTILTSSLAHLHLRNGIRTVTVILSMPLLYYLHLSHRRLMRDAPEPTLLRPKLSVSLLHLTFSPKRPRSPALPLHFAPPTWPYRPTRGEMSIFSQSCRPTARSSSLHVLQVETTLSEGPLRTQDVNLDIALRPPTPSTANSNFTRLAKGPAREIEAEQSRQHEPLEVEVMHVDKNNGLTQRAQEKRAITGRLRSLR
jgi:hypothetical protein